MSKIKVTGSNFYRITSLWTPESTSFNGFLFDIWPWKSIGFQILWMTRYVPSLVKIHWRMLILQCSQGCYAVKLWPCDLDLWPWKSIGFQIFLRTKYVPSLVKIHWTMLILECSQGCCTVKFWPGYLDLWPMRLWPWKSIGFRLFNPIDF
jgi:hypothetical protein